MKHTKGKWHYSEFRGDNSEFTGMFVIHNDERDFAYVEDYSDPYNHEEKEANAELIASAPELLKQNADLLEALKQIHNHAFQNLIRKIAKAAIKANEK